MADASLRLVPLFVEQLRLSNVQPNEVVAVLEDSDSPAGYADAFVLAAHLLGARSFSVRVPATTGSGGGVQKAYGGGLPGMQPAIEALKSADMVVDLVRLLFSPEQHEITSAGTRMLLVSEPFDVLSRLLPDQALRDKVERAAEVLGNASSLRITSDRGTDMQCVLGSYPVLEEYGYTDKPGRWDHWPSGFVCTWPDDGSANGTIVLAPGDILLPFKKYVEQDIRLAVENGFITNIDGDFDADYLSRYLESFSDPDAYALSHIGWGVNDRAKWTALGMLGQRTVGMDGRGFAGSVMFSTGPNTEVGGARTTPAHLDIPMRGVTLELDGVQVVKSGKLVAT